MAISVFLVHRITRHFGLAIDPRALLLCAVMALVVNFSAILLSAYLTFNHLMMLVGMVVVSAALVTGFNEFLLRRAFSRVLLAGAEKHRKAEEEGLVFPDEEPEFEPEPAEEPAPVMEPEPTPVMEPEPTPVEPPAEPEPVREITPELVEEPAPVMEPEPTPVVELPVEPEPVQEITSEPIEEPAPVSEPEPTPVEPPVEPEPVQEITPEPVEEPVPVMEPEPTPVELPAEPESVQEITPEPVEEPAPVSEPEPTPVEPPVEPEPVQEITPEPVKEPESVDERIELPDTLASLDDYLDYAYAEKNAGHYAQAAAAYRAAIAGYSDDPYAPFLIIELGNLFKETGDYTEAADTYRRALDLPIIQGQSGIADEFRKNIAYLDAVAHIMARHQASGIPIGKIPPDWLAEIEDSFAKETAQ